MSSLRKLLPSANALFVFEAAARENSFTKAATELNVTQPAVSRMLGRLERHLGTRLFQRTAAGVDLTEDGQLLHRSIAEGFKGVEAALDEIRRRKTGCETVTLSLSSGFATHWLMPRIGALQELCPHIDLRFQLIPGALKGPVDSVNLGMRFLEPDDRDHTLTFFVNEVILPVCSPDYRARRAARSDSYIHLAGTDAGWIDQHRRNLVRPLAQGDLLNVGDYAVVLQAALLGQGIALGWINVVSHWLKTGALVPAGSFLPHTGRRCFLASPLDRPMGPSTAAIRDWLTAEMRTDLDQIEALHPDLGIRRASLQRMSGCC